LTPGTAPALDAGSRLAPWTPGTAPRPGRPGRREPAAPLLPGTGLCRWRRGPAWAGGRGPDHAARTTAGQVVLKNRPRPGRPTTPGRPLRPAV